ncbi:MAG TPA: redoxin family protein [Candidatus Eisenbacteria bacterium]|nr:redoxin family protein [Candidatus Eisenbacteria bacterium]
MLAVLQRLAQLRYAERQRASSFVASLPVGTEAPDFTVSGLSIERQDVSAVTNETGRIALFLSVACSVCQELIESLLHTKHAGWGTIVVLCEGDAAGCADMAQRLSGMVDVLYDGNGRTAARYGISAFPTTVAIGHDRRILGYGNPTTMLELKDFVTANTGVPKNEPPRKVQSVVDQERSSCVRT